MIKWHMGSSPAGGGCNVIGVLNKARYADMGAIENDDVGVT